MTYLLLSFKLAQHRFRAVPALALCAVGYVVGVMVWHTSVWQITLLLAVMGGLSACWLTLILIVLGKWRRAVS